MTAETVDFDTSGRVRKGAITPRGEFVFRPGFWRWDRLPNDFVRGYIRAAFADIQWPDPAEGYGPSCAPRFEWLHPDTLESMLADCARLAGGEALSAGAGANAWHLRQGDWGRVHGFPPLRLSLDPNGKVIAEHG